MPLHKYFRQTAAEIYDTWYNKVISVFDELFETLMEMYHY